MCEPRTAFLRPVADVAGPGAVDQGMFANTLQAYVQISPSLGLIADRLQLKQVRSLGASSSAVASSRSGRKKHTSNIPDQKYTGW